MSNPPVRSVHLSRLQQQQVESLLLQFDRQWSSEAIWSMSSRLKGEESLRRETLVQMACVDMERSWQSGTPRHVEDYLARIPDLGAAKQVVTPLILGEYEARRMSNEPLAMDEIERRFPGHVERARALIDQACDSRAAAADSDAPRNPGRHTQASIDTSRIGDQRDTGRMSAADPASLPSEFGRYRILRQLGAGAMGAVYLAHDSQLDRKVALKTPSLQDRNAPEEMIERFYREARSAATLRHANICPVYDVGQIDGTHYIAMAYIDGRPLSDFTQRENSVPPRAAASIARKLALALDEAHRHGVIHRDLKPANIMIDLRREPVVMDFGLARRSAAAEQAQITQSGMILGTPAYMSTEQLEGNPDRIGPASDQYSLGVILYEMLAGQLPFRGSMTAVVAQIMTESPQPPSELRDGIDRELEAICLKMMAKSASDRYETMKGVADALTTWLKLDKSATSDTSPSAAATSQPDATNEVLDVFAADQRTSADSFPSSLPEAELPEPSLSSGVARRRSDRLRRPPSTSRRLIYGAGAGGVLLLLTIVLMLRTPHGTLRIEIDDPNLQVLVDGETITLQDQTWEGKQAARKHTLSVKVGEQTLKIGSPTVITLADGRRVTHKLAMKLDGVELTSDSFEVSRGTTTVVKITYQQLVEPSPGAASAPGGAPPQATPPPKLSLDDAPPLALDSPSAARKTESAATESHAAKSAQPTTDREPPERPPLEGTSEPHATPIDRQVAERVQLRDFMGTIQLLKSGRKLKFFKTTPLPDEPFHVTIISVRRKRLTTDDMALFGRLEHPFSLYLYQLVGTRDEGVAHLANSPHVINLLIRERKGGITDRTLEYVGTMTNLKSLELGSPRLTDAGVRHLAKLRHLTTLALSGGSITDNALTTIGTLSQLQSLDLRQTAVRGAGLRHLRELPQLKSLRLTYTKISATAAQEIGQLSQLESLSLPDSEVGDRELEAMTGLASLVSLDLARGRITDSGVKHVAAFTGLSTLALQGTQVTDEGLKTLGTMNQLINLGLADTQVTDVGMAHLSSLRRIYQMTLNNTLITDASVDHLSRLKSLRFLYLRNTKMSADGLDRLEKALPRCKIYR